jgi:hypothetical protein
MSQDSIGTESSGTLNGDALRTIATRQKMVINCMVIYLFAGIIQFAVPEELRVLLGIAVFAVVIVATVFVFLLATKVYSTGVGVLLGILTLIPLIGMITLLMVSIKATSILQQNGIKVGLLGAKM